jgi:hypothetical protein
MNGSLKQKVGSLKTWTHQKTPFDKMD